MEKNLKLKGRNMYLKKKTNPRFLCTNGSYITALSIMKQTVLKY